MQYILTIVSPLPTLPMYSLPHILLYQIQCFPSETGSPPSVISWTQYHMKTGNKPSYQTWMRQPSTMKRVPKVDRRVRHTPTLPVLAVGLCTILFDHIHPLSPSQYCLPDSPFPYPLLKSSPVFIAHILLNVPVKI